MLAGFARAVSGFQNRVRNPILLGCEDCGHQKFFGIGIKRRDGLLRAARILLAKGTAATDSAVRIDAIYALKIVSERISRSESSWISYELNLILNNGRRINVVDHGNGVKIRKDAKRLTEFLNVPIWDAM